jgi:nicotinamidase-related amidase
MTLNLDVRTTALVLIDLQKGIMSAPRAPYSSDSVVEKSVSLGRRINDGGGVIALVHVGFSADGRDRLTQPVDEPNPAPAGGMPADWTDFHPDVAALNAAVVIKKRQWGAFHGTELDLQLRRRGVKTIVLAGIATNFGVESTARAAWEHAYDVVIAEDACTTVTAEMHTFSMEKIFPRIARVRSTADVLAALGS